MHPLDPVYYLPVPGTWAWKERPDPSDWYHPHSALAIYLADRACFPIRASRPFEWNTELGGHQFWRRWFDSKADHRDWLVAGRSLFAWIRPPVTDSEDYIRFEDRNLIAHSHGLQVVLYACASGLRINKLISVGSPVRKDMRGIAEAARVGIRHWMHIHSDRSDRMQWLGEAGDGMFGIVRQHPLADVNVPIGRVGHSQILHDRHALHWWEDAGLVSFLRSSDAEQSPSPLPAARQR